MDGTTDGRLETERERPSEKLSEEQRQHVDVVLE
jgi:hypothetical protein